MKKVGIMTFHYADNYGAVLQAYSLQKAINSIMEYEAEIINYIPDEYCYYCYEVGEVGVNNMKKKRRLFDLFLMKYCKIDSNLVSVVTDNMYDYYCVGSDQVWNTELRENVTLEYFFPNVTNKKKCFSYAASIATQLNDLKLDVFKQYLPNLKGVSLRETEGYSDVLKKTCGINVVKTLDPTLLLQKEDFEELTSNVQKKKEGFIFFFWYLLDDEMYKGVEFVNRLSEMYNLPVVHSIVNPSRFLFKNDGGCMIYEGIEDFLWYIKNASYVVTNSFHGMTLSIQLEKPFYVFFPKIRKNRIGELLSLLELEDRAVDKYINPSKIKWDINYEKVKIILDNKKEESMKFLRSMLND